MKPGIIYRLSWNTVPSVISATVTIPAMAMVVDILDTETLIDDADIPQVIDLLPSSTPLVIRIINNDRDKFSPIRAKQAIIQFMSDSTAFQDVTTFSDSSDNRWKVQITADGNPVFYGFLMLPDSSMPFQPDPNLVQLTATDHLGALKDIPLSDDDNENPIGKYRIAEFIALCLKKTGLTLDIVAVNNLRSGSGAISPPEVIFGIFSSQPQLRVASAYGSFFYKYQVVTVTGTVSNNTIFHITSVSDDGTTTYAFVEETISSGESSTTATLTDSLSALHFYDGTYLDVKTFEQEIGLSEFCYTVLEKILGEDCFLSQWQGKWYIMRVDEYDGNPIYPATFDGDGVFVSFDSPTSFNKPVGATEVRRFANVDQLLEFDRPNYFIKDSYKYEFSKEFVCNIDFSRGDFIADLPDEIIDGQNYQVKKYSIECWALARYRADGTGTLVTGATTYVKKYYQFGYEKFREAIVTPFAESNPFNYLRSEGVAVGNGDRLTISVDFKITPRISADSWDVFGVQLVGDSGAVYIYSALGIWVSASIFGNASFAAALYNFTDDAQKDEYNNVSVDLPSTPESGTMYIFLFGGIVSGVTPLTMYYKNLQVEYKPLVNGSYLVYTGNYDKVQRSDVGFAAKRERQVYIQDALRKSFKGALMFISGQRQLFSGTITFGAPHSINLPGYKIMDYAKGQKIILTGTNAGLYTVTTVTYHLIGDSTQIDVKESITTVIESATISEYIFSLTTRWYAAALVALGNPALTDLHPYAYLQAYSIWNQYRNANRIFSGGVLGLGSMWCDALDKISLTDNNPNTNNRYFMLISFEQNWKTALWSGVFIEDYRTDIGKIYTDDHEFKFLT